MVDYFHTRFRKTSGNSTSTTGKPRRRTVPSQITKVEVAGVGSRQQEDLQEEFAKFAGKPLTFSASKPN